MTLEDIQAICKGLPAVTEDVKWGNDLCFCVGARMFVVTSLDAVPVTASFKTSDEDFEKLSALAGFKPAPYMARNKWVFVEDISLLSEEEWKTYITGAYNLVKAKLSKKFQREIGLI